MRVLVERVSKTYGDRAGQRVEAPDQSVLRDALKAMP
jgi:hypothetical protein